MTTVLERQEVPLAIIPGENREYLTFRVNDQLFGITVSDVHDVLNQQSVTPVCLAAREVAGVLNLRGHIVTAIDVHRLLGLAQKEPKREKKGIVVDYNGDLYNLMVDAVEDVLTLSGDTFERNPSTLNPKWRTFSKGVHRLDGRLLVILDVSELLEVLN